MAQAVMVAVIADGDPLAVVRALSPGSWAIVRGQKDDGVCLDITGLRIATQCRPTGAVIAAPSIRLLVIIEPSSWSITKDLIRDARERFDGHQTV